VIAPNFPATTLARRALAPWKNQVRSVKDGVNRSQTTATELSAAPRQLMRRLFLIVTDDPIRRTVNQGLQAVILGMLLLTVSAAVWSVTGQGARFRAYTPVLLAFIPLTLLAFWLTRRGGSGGALLLLVAAAISNAVAFLPATYASPPVIHVLFLLPALIAALFILPWMGLLGALLQTATLTLALVLAGATTPVVLTFAVVCGLDLVGVMLPIMVVAGLFRRSLTDMAQLAVRLDEQVAERTAELHRQIALREQDISAIVHDIHNRMAIVRAEVDELLLDAATVGTAPSTLHASERRVSAAIGAVGDLVGDLRTAVQLDHAALRLDLDPLDLEALARRVVDQLSIQAAQSACAISVSRHGALPLVSGDERKLERVLANLVGNAVKYSRQVPPARRSVTVTVRPANMGVELLIEDSGPGIEPAALATLGQPFVRLASARGTDGMGLGIYISRGIVELHGGRVSFSSLGHNYGTLVTIWLPAAPELVLADPAT